MARQLAPRHGALSTLALEAQVQVLQLRVAVLTDTLATLLDWLREDALTDRCDLARAKAVEQAYRLLLGADASGRTDRPSIEGDVA